MSKPLAGDDQVDTLPSVDRPPTTWARQRQCRKTRNDWFQVKVNERSTPEEVSESIATFPTGSKTRTLTKKAPTQTVEETVELFPSTRKLRSRKASFIAQMHNNYDSVPRDCREAGTRGSRNMGWTSEQQTGGHIQPAEAGRSEVERFSSRTRHSFNYPEQRSFQSWSVPKRYVPVPKLNLPLDFEADDSSIDHSGVSGNQATPSTPENTDRSDSCRFGVKPSEVSDPLEELLSNQPVSERKYSILPAIGELLTLSQASGGSSHWNQLDYVRDKYESDAEVFSGYNTNMVSPELVSHVNLVPLPPIKHGSECWSPQEERECRGAAATEHRDESRSRGRFAKHWESPSSPPASK